MKLRIPQPSMALNAEDTLARLQFEQTMKVGTGMSVEHILGHSANMARGTKAKKMHTLAISCHGAYFHDLGDGGHTEDTFPRESGGFGLLIGSGGILMKNHRVFSAVRGCFGQIIFLACGTADDSPGGVNQNGFFKNGVGFCKAVAVAAGCPVLATDDLLTFDGPFDLPFGTVEAPGRWWRFDAENPRTLLDGPRETLGS